MEDNNIHNLRQQKILKVLSSNSYLSVIDLANTFQVTEATIRKDLRYLENLGLVSRKHGGVVGCQDSIIVGETHNLSKEKIHISEKQLIAQAALNLINDQDFVSLAPGTTTQYLATEIVNSEIQNLSVLSATINTSVILQNKSDINLMQVGGDIRLSSGAAVGIYSEQMIKNYFSGKLFFGADGIDLQFGISTSTTVEVELNRMMIENSEKVILLADSSKIGKRGFSKIVDIECIDVLITDAHISDNDYHNIKDLGIEIIIAEEKP
ncbi:DeoR/GlpR family DNA-binding transcription regulator [Apibacter raozihei]|uniref:DeoR/GlpR family DNA-binding transcription regulator n=1 Tax=Apibacter TaxID=1778601 RepID=UPI000FE424C8|nr:MULTISPECIES: DeoR/GlpR family DNA-binding transcription regulator [Apibacter]